MYASRIRAFERAVDTFTMDGADPTNVPSPDPSEQAEPTVDAFGPPHGQTISDSLQLWILIPGLIGLIIIGEQTCTVMSCSLFSRRT